MKEPKSTLKKTRGNKRRWSASSEALGDGVGGEVVVVGVGCFLNGFKTLVSLSVCCNLILRVLCLKFSETPLQFSERLTEAQKQHFVDMGTFSLAEVSEIPNVRLSRYKRCCPQGYSWQGIACYQSPSCKATFRNPGTVIFNAFGSHFPC